MLTMLDGILLLCLPQGAGLTWSQQPMQQFDSKQGGNLTSLILVTVAKLSMSLLDALLGHVSHSCGGGSVSIHIGMFRSIALEVHAIGHSFW